MKRREFLKAGAWATAAITLDFETLQAAISTPSIATDAIPDMVTVAGGEPEIMLEKALEALGGIEKYVKKGEKIVIKPNISWNSRPEMAGNTNPQLVKALVKKCREAGAQKVTVFDHTCEDWQKCYETSGIAAAVEEAGGIIVPANDEKYYQKTAVPNGKNLHNVKIHEALIEADAWINVPVLKSHRAVNMTGAMKNYMGIVWDRRFFLQNDLQQCIADICTWEKKPVLNIVDAYRVMHQNGPQGKSLADVATLKAMIVSSDIVAVDTAALALFNQVKRLDLAAVSYIGRGEANRLGTTDLKSLHIQRIRL